MVDIADRTHLSQHKVLPIVVPLDRCSCFLDHHLSGVGEEFHGRKHQVVAADDPAEWVVGVEDLTVAAINDAVRKVEQTVQEKFSGMAAGLNLPPGMKLPF